MGRRKLLPLAFLLACLCPASASFAQYDGYTLYAVQSQTKAYLIDNSGTVYHSWTFASGKTTGYSTYLLSGNILLRTINHSGNSFNGGGSTGEVMKVDWNGNVTWDYVYSTSSYCCHHDICGLPNGNVLLIAWESKTAAEVVQAGCSVSKVMWPDKIVEIQPSGTSGGTVVWEWHAWDHLCQTYNSAKSNYVTSILAHPELLNINNNNSSNEADWMHCNGIDYNATLDQITFSSHNLNEVYVIDHSTTTAQAAGHSGGNSGKGGDILYRWGNPAAYQASGTTVFNVVHDAHWVPSTNPNFPNSLCGFNNKGGSGTKSCVDIFTPPYNGYTYSFTTGTAYSPSTYSWRHTYSGSYTNDMGNSQQLPNGNTLICIAGSGYLYEINSSQTVVWSKTISGTVPQAFRYPPCYVTGTFAAAPTATPSSLCAGNAVQLGVTVTGGTAYTYSWSSSPAGFTSSLASPTVSPTVTTVYTVAITNGPCSATNSITVTVNPKPAATAGTDRSVCAGQSTQIGATAVSGSTYSWTSTPSGFTSTLANPVVSPTVTTIYTLVETVTATGCTNNNAVTVTVNPLPAANAGTSASVCLGSTTQIGAAAVGGSTYSWSSVPAGFSSILPNPTVIPAVTTTYTLVETTTATGCSNSHAVTITVNPLPEAYTGPKQTLCEGNTVQLGTTAVAGHTYNWTSDPTGFSSTLSNPVAAPVVSTLYTLDETITATGCNNTNTVQMTVNPLPLPADSISGPGTVQQGATGISYSVPAVANAAGYQWSLPTGATITAGSGTNSIMVDFSSVAVSGTVSVSGFNSCGNGTAYSKSLTVSPLVPALVQVADTTVPTGETACFQASQVLTLGNSTPGFNVNTGGSVTLISGQSIFLEPKASAQPGSYLWGYITTSGSYCQSPLAPLPAVSVGTETNDSRIPETGMFRIYPNPFHTCFTLVCTDDDFSGTLHATIISLQGKMLFAAEYPVAEKAEIRPGSLAPGIYVLRVFSGDRQAVLKIAVK